MLGVLIATMTAFLMERLLRSFDLLAQSRNGFGFLLELAVDLAPHYLGLTLPAAFFIALFVVVDSLNNTSEIDAMLASGVSLSRVAKPFVVLGVLLMVFSLLLYGFIQPYSRYGYRAVLHAAENAGWNGTFQAQALVFPTRDLLLTADAADPGGQNLERVFIRRLSPSGREDVLTASSARVRRSRDGREVTFDLRDGQQLSTDRDGAAYMLTFRSLTLRVPAAAAARLLRSRGSGEESELTLMELAAQGFGVDPPALPRQTLLAELYSRLLRALALPFMPLLAIPLGLSAKRAGPRPAMLAAGLLLFSFQASLEFGRSLAASGGGLAIVAEGLPGGIFAAACVGTFLVSRKRPGENPVNWAAERISDAFRPLGHGSRVAEERP